ncbi:MAG TPA: nucleoside 2-deoxyribosyltransferase domain-containing protein [Candidatus Paceibacterota bacterium]|nr:nucleoside 2-deoxyribosyltransferase domain-containing protein [Candidatus Paceibacterota bacterium]
MDIVYTPGEPRDARLPTIFLAGPTPRKERPVPSWRPAALQILADTGFNGNVIVPEPAPGDGWPEYAEQVRWEHRWLNRADVVLFWVPRDMVTMPAMTTNVEFGMFMRSGKAVVGAPRHAPHMQYWEAASHEYGIPYSWSLQGAVGAAVAQATLPTGSERILSRPVAWNGGYVRVETTKYLDKLGKVRWYETVRRNTFGDIVSVFALTRDRQVVLVSSYRVPHDAWVVEKPAGLADRDGEPAEKLAERELAEETGYGGGTPMELVLRGPFNAGASSDVMSVFFTKDVVQLHEPQLESSEDLRTLLVPLDGLVEFVERPPANQLVDMKLLAALPVLHSRGLI